MKERTRWGLFILLASSILMLAVYTGPLLDKEQPMTAIITPGDTSFRLRLENSYSLQGSALQIPLGIEGATTATGKGLAGISLEISGLPSYLSNPRITMQPNDWQISTSGLNSGAVTFNAFNVTRPITANQSNFATISFDIGTIGTSTDRSFDIKATLSDNSIPSQSHVLAPFTVTVTPTPTPTPTPPPTPSPTPTPAVTYTISGTISGEKVRSVALVCNKYKSTTDALGNYTFTGIPDHTSCQIKPSASGYEFIPRNREVTVSGTNVVSQTFYSQAKDDSDDDEDENDDDDEDEDDEDEDDSSNNNSSSNHTSSNNTSSSPSNRSTPRTGLPEASVLVIALIAGMATSVVYLVRKMK